MEFQNLNEYDSSTKSNYLGGSIRHSKNNKLCFSNMSRKIIYDNKMEMHDYGILDQYRGLIMQQRILTEIDDVFHYKPELLSKKLYGTSDLWYLILFVNDIFHPDEFTRNTIYVYNPEKINLLNEIVEKEAESIRRNNMDIPHVEDLTLKPVILSDY